MADKILTDSEIFEHSIAAVNGTGRFSRFQVFVGVMISMMFMSNNHIFYAIPTLVMFPKYVCDDTIVGECDHVAHCDNPLHVEVDWSD